METYAGAALSGLGYALTQDRDTFQSIQNQTAQKADLPSMKNIYESTHYIQTRQEEFDNALNNWSKSQRPMETGVVPRPAYADMFLPISPEPKSMQASGKYVESLSGNQIPIENFQHNNMQPFFRKDVTQNVDPFASTSYLENSTGRGEYLFKHKQETQCFFEPTPHMGNVCGMKDNSDYYISHIESPIKRNNDFPIEQVRVGPGLNLGFTAKGEGGFQQTRTLDYAAPKTVDQLRPLSRPKSTYELPFQGPQKIQTGGTRGLEGTFAKNRPDTYFEQSKDQWLHTTGAVIRETERPELIVKPTARVDSHVDYKGHLAAVVKAIVAPLTDILKRTPKEYLVDAPRTFGNMHAQIPEKPTTYDPVTHALRTTIKETTVHDTTILNAKGPDGIPVQSEDDARTTNRQTLESFETTRNVNAHVYKAFVYDPEEISRRTNRETTSTNINQHGYVMGSVSQHTPMSYEAEYNAEIDGTREMMNIKSGNTPGAGGAYVGLTKDGIDMEIKKLTQDYMAAREQHNVTRIYQPTAKEVTSCEVTKTPQGACLVEQVDRLDPGILSSQLKDNPYNLSVNPI